MPTTAELFPGRFLKAIDAPRPRLETIERVAVEVVGRGDEARSKPVAYFENERKALVLNATNFRVCAAIAGDDNCDHWAGVQVVLFAADVEYAGSVVKAIRIRAPRTHAATKPAPRAPQTIAAPDAADIDDIPF